MIRDHTLAEEIVERLLADIYDERPGEFLTKYEVFTADVEAGVDHFRALLQYHQRRKTPFPCIALGDSKPIPIDWLPTLLWRRTRLSHWPFRLSGLHLSRAHIDRFIRMQFRTRPYEARLRSVHYKEAIYLLKEGLVAFLTVRCSARQSNISHNPGLRFEVRTKRHGLRVHYSPAYFLNMSNVFGSPTSPVISWIQPGRYVFGVQGPRDTVPTMDPGQYDIPPLRRAELTVA